MDGFGGRDSGGLLEYIKSEDAEDERGCNFNVGKEGRGNTENVASQRKSCNSHLWKRLRRFVCSSTVHATSLNPCLTYRGAKILNFLIVPATNVSECCGVWTY